MNLWADFLANDGRVVHKWKHYFPIYERHFRDFVYKPITFLEIGCGLGGSLQMWKRYFGPHATIVGIDISPECKEYEEDQIEVRIGPQQDTHFLKGVIEEFGRPDIVLDDGSHVMSHVVTTFEFLYPQVAKNGIYMVEDLHTAYWEEYEGGLCRQGTFIELCKTLVDELNADHIRDSLVPTDFTKTTLAMHLYDSVAVFERGAYTKKWAPRIGSTGADIEPAAADQIQAQSKRAAAADPAVHMTSELKEAVAARDQAQAALRETRHSLAAAQDTLAKMQNSVSWRLTEPIRRLMFKLRSGARST